MSENDLLVLRTSEDTLAFDPRTGRLVSFRNQASADQEFIASRADHPAFLIQYLDQHHHAHWLDSRSAQPAGVTLED